METAQTQTFEKITLDEEVKPPEKKPKKISVVFLVLGVFLIFLAIGAFSAIRP